MAAMDLNAELREYQWRRKFESEPRRTLRVIIIAAILLLILIVIARSIFLR
jgi:hypothetical protein